MGKIRLGSQKLLLSLAVVCGIGVLNADTVFSQTTPTFRILRVKATSGTTFKSRESWYKQSKDIASDEKCPAKSGEKFFVSSIRRVIQNAPARPKGNTEKLSDYWEVTFEKPLPCEDTIDNNQTWYVYKSHVQELRGVLVP
ncbi:hypothetical protein [Sphaerospermopsis aphanizomenoides]|uniref:hypothetical protein n=1 Tax=Sphaerospermopsis aphanizomenoides TaxID=459663 RepID=UPI001F35A53B|nr:hypothetical protein [Sphaerospermopsis aphanizomenoides]